MHGEERGKKQAMKNILRQRTGIKQKVELDPTGLPVRVMVVTMNQTGNPGRREQVGLESCLKILGTALSPLSIQGRQPRGRYPDHEIGHQYV